MTAGWRPVLVFGGIAALIVGTGFVQSWSGALNLLTVGLISAIMTLGLNLQLGYAGLFNAGVMGFAGLGALSCVLVSMPWVTGAMVAELAAATADGGGERAETLRAEIAARRTAQARLVVGAAALGVAALIGWAGDRILRPRVSRGRLIAFWLAVIALGYLAWRTQLDPASEVIESTGIAYASKFLGGLGMPSMLGWLAGGALAAVAGAAIGRIALGLRSDYLAIATLGIAEIVIAVLKNEGWLTRGTLNVTGLPTPAPSVDTLRAAYGWDAETAVILSNLIFLGVVAAFLIVFLLLAHRLIASPWGRMMRAIRDNDTAAEAMGKDVVARRRQVFILGAFLIGVGGAMLATNVTQFEPAGYRPLRYTFLIWVMVLVGGKGNNFGAVAGGILVWFLWIQAEPAAAWLFGALEEIWGGEAAAALTDRAAQMRRLVMGVALLLVLRFAPRGLLPEPVVRG